jgi:hypothetical protein
MGMTFNIHVRTTAGKLTPILQLLENEPDVWVKDVTVVEPEATDNGKKRRKRTHYVGGKHIKAMSGLDLALKLFNEAGGGLMTTVKLGKQFELNGFAHNSASGVLTQMTRDGVIEKISHGVYRLKTKATGS